MGTRTKGPGVTQIRRGLSDTQVKSTEGRAASSVVCQSSKGTPRGAVLAPVSGAQVGVGKGLAHAQTRNSSGVVKQS